jgi:serine-type D-Ala-D-Ala carboxypeptidase (penicillin-binding protein 5/6)
MSDLEIIQRARARRAAREAGARRAKQARRRRHARLGLGLLAAAVGIIAIAVLALGAAQPKSHTHSHLAQNPPVHSSPRAAEPATPAPVRYGQTPAPQMLPVHLKLGLRSGLLFDVRSGRVLWERIPERQVPIASLTKMMTALVVVAHASPDARVRITRDALHYSGSGVGLLPLGKRVSLRTLLYGLLLPSGNDAAIALSEYVGRTQARFIAMMNDRAHRMGLTCTHFSTVSGIVDVGNYSCASDLAVITHAVLRQRLLGRIVASRSAVLPLPVKGGKVWLYNNNALLRLRYPGADGVKTGFTTLAGQCLVASARRGRRWLAVVLLNSADPPDQAMALLNAGFADPLA